MKTLILLLLSLTAEGGTRTIDADIIRSSDRTKLWTMPSLTGTVARTADNVATSSALAADPADCAANTYATTIAANGDLTCASISNASTTATASNTNSTIVLRDGSGNFAASTITAALAGNASTSSALAANPADCAADQYATTIAANGDLTCASISNASTTATALNTNSTIVLRDGSGNFAASTITAALSGNSSTATALAANPSDCSSNQFATTIAANGNLTCAALTGADLPAPGNSTISASDIDWSLLKNKDGFYTKTLSANTTLTWSNVASGQTIVIALTNTASNYTVTWPAAAKFPGGTAPTQTLGAKTDVITCKSYDGTNAYCSFVQNY